MINPYSIGKQVYLRAPNASDANDSSWYEWFSDPEVTRYLGESRFWPNSIEAQVEFFESIKSSKDRLVLMICDKETDELIGVSNLSQINWVHRYADVALVIGEEKYRKGTVAVETMLLLLDIAFNRLNLRNIKAGHISTNPMTPVLCKLCGFEEVGRFKNLAYYFGDYVDTVFYQLSRETWLMRNQK